MTSHSKSLKSLSEYPVDQLMGFIVDGCLLEQDPLAWVDYDDREPGCLESGFMALAHVVQSLDKAPLNVQYIKSLHAKFTSFIHFSQIVYAHFNPGVFRDGHVKFRLSTSTTSQQGIKELLLAIKSGLLGEWGAKVVLEDGFIEYSRDTLINTDIDDHLVDDVYQGIKNLVKYTYYAPSLSRGELQNKVEWLLSNFEQTMGTIQADDDKLAVIVKLIYDLDHLHPFPDANCRVFVIGLSMRLLSEYGFTPAIFHNPNIFDGYSQLELLEAIKEGMKRVQRVIDDKTDPWGYTFEERTPSDLKKRYFQMVAPFIDALKVHEDTLTLPKKTPNKISFFSMPSSPFESKSPAGKDDFLACPTPSPDATPVNVPSNHHFFELQQVDHSFMGGLMERLDENEGNLLDHLNNDHNFL